jgi:hypothetical protein
MNTAPMLQENLRCRIPTMKSTEKMQRELLPEGNLESGWKIK